VLAAGDKARELRENPAWINRHRAPHRNPGARRARSDDVAVDGSVGSAPRVGDTGSIDVAEIYSPFTHQHLILTEAIGLPASTKVNPSGGALAANPMFSAGLNASGSPPATSSTGQLGGFWRTPPAVLRCNRIWSPFWKERANGRRSSEELGRRPRDRADQVRRQSARTSR